MQKENNLKSGKVRKEVHLLKESIRDLKIAAAYADKSSKKYMEDAIMNKIEEDLRSIKMKGIKNQGDLNEPRSHFLRNPNSSFFKKAFRFRV